ncbi:MAG: hypothetical protein HYR56_03465 [Acidobacteria bacterium]|nr:hypothetical protein [Acidobacteriota bacterium]MBI3422283.1 hypothetical protein [Acidobacteriota bacterium]
MKNARQRMINASEVSEFAFCAKAWKLKCEGVVADSPHLDAGTAYHRAHQSHLYLAQRLRRLGLALALLALAATLIWFIIKL